MKLLEILPQKLKQKIKNHLIVNMNVVYSLPKSCSDKELNGKIAIVTGGAGGIGGAICKRLSVEGCKVYVCGRTLEHLENVVNDIKSIGGKAEPFVLDVTDYFATATAFNEILKREGHIDFLINSAGGSAREKSKEFAEQNIEVINKMISVNLMGTINTCRVVAPMMINNNSGVIINISSVIGIAGKRFCAEYAAAKAGIFGLSKSLAIELGKNNIRVNVVSPGKIVRNRMVQSQIDESIFTNYLGIPGTPEDISSMVAFLISDAAKFVTGQNICVDGGRSLGLHGD